MGRFKKWLVQYLTKRLLKALTEDDILRMTSKGWFLNKRKLTQEELAQIKEEAQNIEESLVWRLMMRDVEYAAFVKGRKAKTNEENLACHYMFYNLDLLAQFIRNCKQL